MPNITHIISNKGWSAQISENKFHFQLWAVLLRVSCNQGFRSDIFYPVDIDSPENAILFETGFGIRHI